MSHNMKTCAEVPKYLKPYIMHSIQRAWDYQDSLRERIAELKPNIGDPTKDQETAVARVRGLEIGIDWFDHRIEDGEFATLDQCNGARFVIDWKSYYDDRKETGQRTIDQLTALLAIADDEQRPIVQANLDSTVRKMNKLCGRRNVTTNEQADAINARIAALKQQLREST